MTHWLKQRLFSCAYLALCTFVLGLQQVPSAYAQPASEAQTSRTTASMAKTAQRHYTVQPGQSLQDAITQLVGTQVTLTPKQRVALTDALFKANPHAFIAGNPDRLKKEAVLIVPSDFAEFDATLPSANPLASAAPPQAQTHTEVKVQDETSAPAKAQVRLESQPQSEPEPEPEPEPQLQTQSNLSDHPEPPLSPASTSVAVQKTADTHPVTALTTFFTPLKQKWLGLADRLPQLTSLAREWILVAIVVLVGLGLALSVYWHRFRARADQSHIQTATPKLAENSAAQTTLPEASQDIDQMLSQVTSWFEQHPTRVPKLPARATDNSVVEAAPLSVPAATQVESNEALEPEFKSKYETQPQDDEAESGVAERVAVEALPDIEKAADAASAEPVGMTQRATAPSSEAHKNAIAEEIEKLEMASASINLGDLSSAHALIDEVSESVEASLVAQQAKYRSSAVVDETAMDEVEQAEDSSQMMTASASERLALASSEFDTDLSPTSYDEARGHIERNKLALVSEYLKLDDIQGARLLAQEVARSVDPDLRAQAEQMLAKPPLYEI